MATIAAMAAAAEEKASAAIAAVKGMEREKEERRKWVKIMQQPRRLRTRRERGRVARGWWVEKPCLSYAVILQILESSHLHETIPIMKA